MVGLFCFWVIPNGGGWFLTLMPGHERRTEKLSGSGRNDKVIAGP
jgi:hypothetical protein